jgi:hypothetical protein
MKETLPIMLLMSILLSLFACTKNETPVTELELGNFEGKIDRSWYYTLNSKTETFLRTVGYNSGNYIFKFERESVGYAYTHQRLVVSLNNIPQQQSFQLFEPLNNESFSSTPDGISFYTKNADIDGKNVDVRTYTTVKNKRSISVDIDRIDYRDLKIPSLIGKIKGYLYNIENSKDSILIDATFRTQASRY